MLEIRQRLQTIDLLDFLLAFSIKHLGSKIEGYKRLENILQA